MAVRFPISPKGFKRLQEELHQLKVIERPSVIRAIADARAHGDLSENAEYHAAKERQGFIEAKINDLEGKISLAQIIDISDTESDQIQFGATVKIVDEESQEFTIITIVSEYEVDVVRKHISITSPMSRAMIGKKVGDSFELITPKGEKYFQIVEIKYLKEK
jgi:transcription elongation factor GreA